MDLNLLKLLDALLNERSVTRAGARLGLSQPAASRALGRLRQQFGDPLLIRGPHGLEPTPRALALKDAVAQLLEDARALVEPRDFDPHQAQGSMRIASVDHLARLLMPGLLGRLAQQAPRLVVEMPPTQGDNVDLINQGAADIAIGVFEKLPARLHRRRLYDESLVCVVRRGHPLLSSGLSLERYVAAEHVQVVVTGLGDSALDRALARQNLSRRISVRLPHFLVAPQLVVDSDRLLSLPARLARQMAEELPVAVLPLPLDVGVFEVSMIWHERRHADPAQVWLRQQLLEIGQTLAQA